MTASLPAPGTRRSIVALVLSGLSLAVSLLSLGLVLTIEGADAGDPLRVQSKPEPATASQVEAVAQVSLPPGTVFLAAAYSNGLETRLAAKFRIPRTGLDAFLASGRFTAQPVPGLRAVTEKHNVGGGNLWHPERAVTVSGITEEQPTADGTYRSVLFDLDAADSILVYLFTVKN